MDDRRRPHKQYNTRISKVQQVNTAKRRRRRALTWGSIAAAVVVLGGVAYASLSGGGDSNWSQFVVGHRHPGLPDPDSRFTTLVIGTDTRPGETGGNTDVLMVVSIDNKNKRIEILSIPRDTMVRLPDGSTGKINAAYEMGGVEATDQIVENLVGFNIPHYALTHFGGLVQIIDTIGGIWVDVPEPMHYVTGDKVYGTIDLNPGYQKLTGAQALGFVRFREDALGDIGRTSRQQEFIKALEKALLQPGNILKLPRLVSEFSSTIESDLPRSQELGLAYHANTFKDYKVVNETLPGAYYDMNGISYWLVNPKEATWYANRLFAEGVGVSLQESIQTVDNVQYWTPPSNSTKTSH